MSRNNPIGHGAQAPAWRHPADHDPYAAPPTTQPTAPRWPGQQYAEPPGQAGQPQGYGQQPPGQGYYFPPAPEQQAPQPAYGHAGQAPAQPPFSHFPPAQAPSYPPPPQPAWGQQPDPHGYDLGSYMPADTQAYAAEEPAQYHPAGQHGYNDADAEFDDVDDDEEPRRGRRSLMIVAALIGAIGLGGGLAYTYKTFIATKGGRTPVIKQADSGPSKVKPVTPGGKEFAHTDKKLLNRLGDDGGQQVSDAQAQDRVSDDPNSPRRVRVIPITPGDPVSTSSVPPPPMVAIPGLTLDNSGPPQAPPSATRAQLPPPAPPPAARPQPPSPKIAAAPVAPEVAPSKPNAAPKVAVPKAPAPAATAPSTTGTSGYVAVLSSQKSRMDALKAFADLQQKYGDVLVSRTPDVQEANLGEKGIWYRAVVGPPGSRDSASGLCNQLKTAGYTGCWVTAY